MPLTNQQIEYQLSTIKQVLASDGPTKFRHETDQEFLERTKAFASQQQMVSAALDLLGNALQNLNDIAAAANAYSSKP